jgi:hypothetical protein
MELPLEVLADLQLAVDGENVDVQADGERIVVDLPSLRVGRRMLTAPPLGQQGRTKASRRVREALELTGLTLEVRLRGEPIALMGKGATPGAVGRALLLDGVELRPASTLRQEARRRPVATAVVVGGLVLLIGWLLRRLLSS